MEKKIIYHFVESMVSAVHQEPETVFVPTSALTEHKSAFLTWNLSLRAGTALPLTGSNRLLPILDDSAFMIRSDLYRVSDSSHRTGKATFRTPLESNRSDRISPDLIEDFKPLILHLRYFIRTRKGCAQSGTIH